MRQQISDYLSEGNNLYIFFVLFMLLPFSYIIWIILRNKKKRKEYLDKIGEQDRKNIEVVNKIINGTDYYSGQIKINAKKKFAEWQVYQKKLFNDATGEFIAVRNKLTQKKWQSEYLPLFYSDKEPIKNIDCVGYSFQLVMEDIFTEPFPSTHDMDDWAMCCLFGDLMTLSGISKEHAKKYYMHKKYHFVNHSICLGIMCFSLYKKLN